MASASNHFSREKVKDYLLGGSPICVSPVMIYNTLWIMYIIYCHTSVFCPALLMAAVSHLKFIVLSRFFGRLGRGGVLQN